MKRHPLGTQLTTTYGKTARGARYEIQMYRYSPPSITAGRRRIGPSGTDVYTLLVVRSGSSKRLSFHSHLDAFRAEQRLLRKLAGL